MLSSFLNQLNEKLYNPDLAKLFIRLGLGMMLFHGIHKIEAGVGGIAGLLTAHGLPAIFAQGVYLGEVVAPILIMLGILCRLSSIVMIGTMLVAYLLVGLGKTFAVDALGAWAIENIMFYVLMSLALLFLGSGRFSVVPAKWR